MITPEFSHIIDLRQITDEPVVLEPDETERRRLAGRFGITAIDTMKAILRLSVDGSKVEAKGKLTAQIVQACAISGEDFPVSISETIALRFVPPAKAHAPDEEIEIGADELDEIEYEGTSFDLGEAVAQSLALAIDPFAEGPDADKARAEHKLGGVVASGPFAGLSALKTKD
jgi:uncharacterized metal-binding protein YceD (DUF177 family)